MEIPDREDDPFGYANMKLEEVKKASWVLEEEKMPVYSIVHDIFCIGREVENNYIEETHRYLVDALDIICSLVLEGNSKKEIGLINEIIGYSKKILQRINEVSDLLELVVDKTKSLEAKSVSNAIVSQMVRNQNH
jgi:hypothetical protein